MALPGSGYISLWDMNQEFGLGYSFNSYRGKGNVPATGMIWFSNMWGATAIITEGPIYGQNPHYFFVDAGDFANIWWNGTQVARVGRGVTTYTAGDGWTYNRGAMVSGGIFTYYQISRTK